MSRSSEARMLPCIDRKELWEDTVGLTGRFAEEYIVHQLEMIVKLLGTDAKEVKTEGQGSQRIYRIRFSDRRMASAIYDPALPFALTVETEAGSKMLSVKSDFFRVLMEKIVRFYETGEVDFAREETLAVMKVREALLAAGDVWTQI